MTDSRIIRNVALHKRGALVLIDVDKSSSHHLTQNAIGGDNSGLDSYHPAGSAMTTNLRFSLSLKGGRAMSAQEFANWKQKRCWE